MKLYFISFNKNSMIKVYENRLNNLERNWFYLFIIIQNNLCYK